VIYPFASLAGCLVQKGKKKKEGVEKAAEEFYVEEEKGRGLEIRCWDVNRGRGEAGVLAPRPRGGGGAHRLGKRYWGNREEGSFGAPCNDRGKREGGGLSPHESGRCQGRGGPTKLRPSS